MLSSDFADWVNSFGIFGPLAYILAQILQMVIAPIPGQVITATGGYLFGWWGILWTLIGTAIGGFIVFWLARKFGRPLIEKFFKKSSISKFEFIFNKNATFIIFIIFLLPGLPDDLICFMAGLTKVPIRTLVIILLLGHLPSIIVTNYIGAGLDDANLAPVVIVTIVVVIIFALFIWQKTALSISSQKPLDIFRLRS